MKTVVKKINSLPLSLFIKERFKKFCSFLGVFVRFYAYNNNIR